MVAAAATPAAAAAAAAVTAAAQKAAAAAAAAQEAAAAASAAQKAAADVTAAAAAAAAAGVAARGAAAPNQPAPLNQSEAPSQNDKPAVPDANGEQYPWMPDAPDRGVPRFKPPIEPQPDPLDFLKKATRELENDEILRRAEEVERDGVKGSSGPGTPVVPGGNSVLGTAPLTIAPPLMAPVHDPAIDTAVLRGLVGQRGPTEKASADHGDARLPYELPAVDELAKRMPPARRLLARAAAPTEHEVDRAIARLHAVPEARTEAPTDADAATEPAPKRARVLPTGPPAASVVDAALAAFEGNFAMIDTVPVLGVKHCTRVEGAHQVRWLPQGPRAPDMARAAVLEHAIARCVEVAALPDVQAQPAVARELRLAALALKLRQLAPLYALTEAVEFDDAPHPLGTGARALVTRPCAVVRGALSFPTAPGIAPAPKVRTGSAWDDAAKLQNAMSGTQEDTSAARNALRRRGFLPNVYVAPPVAVVAFRAAPAATGAPADGGGASEALSADDVAMLTLRRLANQALVAMSLESAETRGPTVSFVREERDAMLGGVDAHQRRDGLWTEFHRNMAISQDRLWVFVRLLSGGIGGDVSEVITMADQASQQATKALQAQRVEVAKRVSDTQAKIIESVVGAMLKDSKLSLDKAAKADALVVVDEESRKQARDLLSGASGRPHWEANVAATNLTRSTAPMPLSALLTSLAQVGDQMQRSLDRTLAAPGLASASLAELSHPSNSFFVSMRPDAVAAIRTAHERLNTELAHQGAARRLWLWELVEGGCTVLTTRFADFCGHILVQNRSSTGVSAMYVSHMAITTNAHQARVSLARLSKAARIYATRVARPSTPPSPSLAQLKELRSYVMDRGATVRDFDMAGNPHRGALEARYRGVRSEVSASGWGNPARRV